MGAKIYPLLAMLAAWAAWRATPETRRLALTFFVMWIVLILFAALGAALPGMGSLQPNRFSAMGYLFLVVPAAMGMDIVVQSIRSKNNVAWLAKLTLVAALLINSIAEVELKAFGPAQVYAVPPEAERLMVFVAQSVEPTAAITGKELTNTEAVVVFVQLLASVTVNV